MKIKAPWIDYSITQPPINRIVFIALDISYIQKGYRMEDHPKYGPQLILNDSFYDGDRLPIAWMEVPPISEDDE